MGKLLLIAVVAGGLFVGIHQTPKDRSAFVSSAEAAVPVPDVPALLGIDGLAIALRQKRNNLPVDQAARVRRAATRLMLSIP